MRLTICGILFSALLAASAGAQETPNPEITATIQGQFDAFRADDYARAFTFASPTIKGLFGTPERFGMMVQNGYPMVDKPASVTMLELRDVSGVLWQRVLVTDQAGRSHVLDYQMIETPEGWQINAVQLLPSAGVGA